MNNNLKQIFGASIGVIPTDNIKPGQVYGWFPCTGDSMTIDAPECIPDGCMALGRLLDIENIYELSDYMHQPVIIQGKTMAGMPFSVLKTITFINAFNWGSVRLTSYNKRHRDFWVPFDCITEVFLVEQKRIRKGKTWITTPVKSPEQYRNVI